MDTKGTCHGVRIIWVSALLKWAHRQNVTTHDLLILRLQQTKSEKGKKPRKLNLCSRRRQKTLFGGLSTRVKCGKKDRLQTCHPILVLLLNNKIILAHKNQSSF